MFGRVSALCIIALTLIATPSMAQGVKANPSKADAQQPGFIGLEQDGVHTTTYNAILKCNVALSSPFARAGEPLRITGVALPKGARSALKVTKDGLSYKARAVDSLSFDKSRTLWLHLKGKKTPVAAPQGRYELVFSASKASEIISLHIGQAGVQVGAATCKAKGSCADKRVEAALGEQPQ